MQQRLLFQTIAVRLAVAAIHHLLTTRRQVQVVLLALQAVAVIHRAAVAPIQAEEVVIHRAAAVVAAAAVALPQAVAVAVAEGKTL